MASALKPFKTDNVIAKHRTKSEIEASLARLGPSPRNIGTVNLLCTRPEWDERCGVKSATFSVKDGVTGDNWNRRKEELDINAQITLMNYRIITAIVGDDLDDEDERDREQRCYLAGDQIFCDLDLGKSNLLPGDNLEFSTPIPSGQHNAVPVTTLVLEITSKPHNGCKKFEARFGKEAYAWTAADYSERRRGIYAKVIQAGKISVGDRIIVLRKPRKPEGSSTTVGGAVLVASAVALVLGVGVWALMRMKKRIVTRHW